MAGKYIIGGMEEAPENGKESSHSAHANGINEFFCSGCGPVLPSKHHLDHLIATQLSIYMVFCQLL